MKKEVERLYSKYENIIESSEIVLQIYKSDSFDNRSSRCYRISAMLKNGNIIGETGFCKNWKDIVNRFEEKLIKENTKKFGQSMIN